MSVEGAILLGLSGTSHSTVLVSERKLVQQLVLKQFQGGIDFLMHIPGLNNKTTKHERILGRQI